MPFDEQTDDEMPPVQTSTVETASIPKLTPELYHEEKEELEEGVRRALDELEQEVMGKPVEEMTAEELAEAADQMREGELNYLERQAKNEDPGIAARAEFVLGLKEKMDALIDEVNEAVQGENEMDAQKKIEEFLKQTREDLQARSIPGEDIELALDHMQFLLDLDLSLLATEEKEISAKRMVLSLGMDLIPFLGGVKMMAEGAVGKTLAGEELDGMHRLTHMSEGMFWEMVDVVSAAAAVVSVGVGGAAVQGITKGGRVAKSIPKISRVLTRSGAFMRKYGIKGSKEVFRTGRMLQKNGKAERVAQKMFERGVTQRTTRMASAVGGIEGQAQEALELHQEHLDLIETINEERAELTRVLSEMAQPQG